MKCQATSSNWRVSGRPLASTSRAGQMGREHLRQRPVGGGHGLIQYNSQGLQVPYRARYYACSSPTSFAASQEERTEPKLSSSGSFGHQQNILGRSAHREGMSRSSRSISDQRPQPV